MYFDGFARIERHQHRARADSFVELAQMRRHQTAKQFGCPAKISCSWFSPGRSIVGKQAQLFKCFIGRAPGLRRK